MTKHRIKWFGIAIILLIAFIFLTPITLFFGVTVSVLVSMLEGVVCAFFIALGVLDLKNIDELDKVKDGKTSKQFTSIARINILVGFVVFSMIIYKGINKRIDYKLKNEGVFTTARILDGERITRKTLRRTLKSNTYNIEIVYKDSLKNKEHQFKTEIDGDIFKLLSKNQEVNIVYLPESPSVFKIMLGDNITKYKDIPNRDLNFTDFERLLDSKNIKNEISYLDSISFRWKKDVREEGVMFVNELKGEYVGIREDGVLYYRGENIENLIESNQFLNVEEFSETREDGKGFTEETLYETENLSIIKVYEVKYDLINSTSDKYLLIEKKW